MKNKNKIVVATILVLAALISYVGKSKANEIWITASVASYHTDRSKGYNEFNPGIGIEYSLHEKLRLAGGTYKNSLEEQSTYLGLTYLPWEIGLGKLGVAVGFISGYHSFGSRDDFYPMVIPVYTIEGQKYGANFIIAPPIKDMSGVIGLQLKYKF